MFCFEQIKSSSPKYWKKVKEIAKCDCKPQMEIQTLLTVGKMPEDKRYWFSSVKQTSVKDRGLTTAAPSSCRSREEDWGTEQRYFSLLLLLLFGVTFKLHPYNTITKFHPKKRFSSGDKKQKQKTRSLKLWSENDPWKIVAWIKRGSMST